MFNLDNKNLFYFDLLLDYLHLMVEGRNPLVAYLRASQHSHTSQSLTQGARLAVLRRAWNAFARLLDIDFTNSFQCPICAQYPDIVICDSTMLGFRKDFLALSHLDYQQEDMPLLSGTKHKDRVLIQQPKTRQLLAKYSGITSDRKKIKNPKSLTQSEFSSLKANIAKEGFQALADLLTRLNSSRTRTCPEAYRVFLSEIARQSSVWTTTTRM